MPLLDSRLPKALLLTFLSAAPALAWAQGAPGAGLSPPPMVQVEEAPFLSSPADGAPEVALEPLAPEGQWPQPDAQPHPTREPERQMGRVGEDAAAGAFLRGGDLGRAEFSPSAVTITLRDAGLPPPNPALRSLRHELASLPVEVHPNGATSVGHFMTDLALTGLFFGTVGFFSAQNELEQGFFLVMGASSLVVLPVAGLTWLVGEIVDGHRRSSLEKRRRRLMREIDREMGFDPHG